MFYGPRLQTAQLRKSVSGVKVEWLPNLKPLPTGDTVQVAVGHITDACSVGIERMNRDAPTWLLYGASAAQIDQMRASQMDILDVAVVCT
jgi:hypothetical protein